MLYLSEYSSPLGKILLAGRENRLCGLWFQGQKNYPAGISGSMESLPVLMESRRWLDIYFGGREPDFTPPLLIEGTEFASAVYESLMEIPYGKTLSYGELGERIRIKRGLSRVSPRAVGAALGRNPILLILPCHRITGADGSIKGYAGGSDRKRRLLLLEKAGILRRNNEN